MSRLVFSSVSSGHRGLLLVILGIVLLAIVCIMSPVLAAGPDLSGSVAVQPVTAPIASPAGGSVPMRSVPPVLDQQAVNPRGSSLVQPGIVSGPIKSSVSVPKVNTPSGVRGLTNTNPPVNKIEESGNGSSRNTINLTLEASDYSIKKDADGYDTIQMDGYASNMTPGFPILPIKSLNVLLPPDAIGSSVRLKVLSSDSKIIDGTYNIKSAGRLARSNEENETIAEESLNVYSIDSYYPTDIVSLLPYSEMRKWKYAKIEYSPFQYNPVSKKLVFNDNVKIELTYEFSIYGQSQTQKSDTVMDNVASSMFINYDQANKWYNPDQYFRNSESGNTYVIITTNQIKSNSLKLNSFIAHKQNLGFNVRVVTENDFSGLTGQAPNLNAEKIRQWLKNNYISSAIKYVLLIGNPDPSSGDIPMKMCWPRFAESDYRDSPTDYFYADLTGNWDIDGDQYYGEYSDYTTSGGVDLSPEVYVGRIPVYNADYTSLDTILQKIISYEADSSVTWRKNILLPMSFSDSSTDGATLAEQMKDDYLVGAGYSYWRMYQQGSGACSVNSIYSSEQELRGGTVVRDRWAANDYGIVTWWGHGYETGAIVGYDGCRDGTLFESTYTSSLDDGHPSFVYLNSCTNGYPELSNNLGYTILKKGGIASVSASRVSWYYKGQSYGTFDGSDGNAGIGYEYVKRVVSQLPAGDALFQTKVGCNPNDKEILQNWFDFNLYGDPALSIKGSTSTTTTVTGITPGSTISGTNPFTVTSITGTGFTTGSSVNKVRLDDGSGHTYDSTVTGTVGSTSITSTQFNLASAVPGSYNVKVSKDGGSTWTSSSTKLLTITASVTAPDIEWEKILTGNNYDVGNGLTLSDNDGFVITGYSSSTNGEYAGNNGAIDIFIKKFSLTGNLVWSKIYGSSGDDAMYGIKQTSDGGFVIAGDTNSKVGEFNSKGSYDGAVLKVDKNGNKQWVKLIGGTLGDVYRDIFVADDGSFIGAGFGSSNDGDLPGNLGSDDGFVRKYDVNGNIIWTKLYHNYGDDEFHSIIPASDGGFVVGGYSNTGMSGHHGGVDYNVFKYDNDGNMQWKKPYGGAYNEYLKQIINAPDGGYVLAGNSWSESGDSGQVTGRHGETDLWIAKIDANGNLERQVCLGGSSHDWMSQAGGIAATSDGGYIIVGGTSSTDDQVSGRIGTEDIWVVKLSSSFDIQWTKCLGKSGKKSTAKAISETNDGGYLILGQNDQSGTWDTWIIKLKPDHTLSPPVVNSITPSTAPNTGTVTISNLAGTGFKAGAKISLKRSGYADIPASNVVVTPSNKITCTFPLSGKTTGSWNIVVKNSDGHIGTQYDGFIITAAPAPTITSITPPTGVSTGSISVTITGTNFVTGTNTVKLTKSGQAAITATNVNLVSATQITCTLPIAESVAGAWDVVLTTGGQTVTTTNGFTITAPTPSSDYEFVGSWGTEGTGNGQFNSPQSITTDSSGNVYVADSSNHRIQKFNSNGDFINKWGSEGTGDGEFKGPEDIVVDSAGFVYVADTWNHRIQKFNSYGEFINKWGSEGSDISQFKYPGGIDLDPYGNVCVADLGNGRIQKFTSNGEFITQFDAPSCEGLAIDSAGNIYIATGNSYSIKKYSSNGNFINKWGTKGSSNSQFAYLIGIAVDSEGNVFVPDTDNHRVQKFNTNGGFTTKWGTYGSGNGQLNTPHGITVDSAGNVYVADSSNHRIVKFRPSVSTPAPTITSITPSTGVNTGSVSATITGTKFATGTNTVKLTKSGLAAITATNVNVVSPNQITCIFPIKGKATGAWNIEVTSGGQTATKTNGFKITSPAPTIKSITPSEGKNTGSVAIKSLTGTGFKSGAKVKLTQKGKTAIVATKVKVISPNKISCTFPIKGKATGAWNIEVTSGGQTAKKEFGFLITSPKDVYNFLWKWGSWGTDNKQLGFPKGIAVDKKNNNVYVVNYYYIMKFNANGKFLAKWGLYGTGNNHFINPEGIAIDKNNNVYVADTGNNRIMKFNVYGKFLKKWGSEGSGNMQFNNPKGIAVDKNNNIFVADTYNHRIMKFNANGKFLKKWGSEGTGNMQFSYPEGIAVGKNNNVFVADTYNHRIMKFNANGKFLAKWGSYGESNMQFNKPEGIAVDKNDNVFVVDTDNDRIMKFNANGKFLAKWGSHGTGNNQLYHPEGIAVNNNNRVYVSDSWNRRISVFKQATTTSSVQSDEETVNVTSPETIVKSFKTPDVTRPVSSIPQVQIPVKSAASLVNPRVMPVVRNLT